jgi:tyrosine-protein kinase Etk/Wzc
MLSQNGDRTILVDADLRRPRIHQGFDLPREPGLTDILVGRGEAALVVRPDVADNMALLTAGSISPNPSELLGSAAMRALIAELTQQYDRIILDTPPILGVTDAVVVASFADATILVVRAGITQENAAKRAVETISRVNPRVAGCVLNGLDRRKDAYRSYYGSNDRRAPAPPQSLLSRLVGGPRKNL